ncbi:hypothetical protein [Herbaspirillum sp. ST 5-3]|uniref:hypothetical protein n=1 Tax=Oxalobacteraceae TaxID=75682 RepID=UPI0010A4C491|nr:hypothetical protein [Herbaspirillum sp. ST 5-3]
MPEMAAFVESLCREFGDDAIWKQVEKGFAGESTFFARENGVLAGTRDTGSVAVARWDEQGIARLYPASWIIEARALANRRGIEIKPCNPDIWLDDEREAEQLRDMIASLKGRAK